MSGVLTGAELTMLTVVRLTTDPYTNIDRTTWSVNALCSLEKYGLIEQPEIPDGETYHLTERGTAMMEAIEAIPLPTQKWVIE